MEEKENCVKSRRGIPILTKKRFFSVKPNPKSLKSASKKAEIAEISEKKDAKKAAPSLANSQASFAAGLRGKSQQPRVVSGKRGTLTPGPGWKGRLWKTPKSILKRKNADYDVAFAKTTGHKQKGLKDATNIEGNRRHVSLKLDFKDGTKRESPKTDNALKNVDKEEVVSVAVGNGVTVEMVFDAGGDETKNNKGHNDSSILSDIQSLSLDISDMTENKENPTPDTSTPDAVTIAEDLNSKKDFAVNTQKRDGVRKLQKLQSVQEMGDTNVDKRVPEKNKKPLTRSATFSGPASRRNVKPASDSSKPQYGGYNRGIRRYSDLKKSEEELIQKNAHLEAKLMESSMRIHDLETSLSETTGRFNEVEHEHFELREELEAKEKYFNETLEKKERFYMKENERLQERLDLCVEKLIQLKIDPVSLESMERTQSQAEKEAFIQARLEARVQCKIFQQKLDSFIRCSEERFNDLMSKDFENFHQAAKEIDVQPEDDIDCCDDPPKVVNSEESVQNGHIIVPSKGDSFANGNGLDSVPQTEQCEVQPFEFGNASFDISPSGEGCSESLFEGSSEQIHTEGLPESSL
ncbi:uncharacterized protein LOC135484609 [Lineus longissimus]|uniref:uncharacterized protein LOC135484609 n=1 Tax=Lineus longissimus TaxID=88925 RepID=UPI00315CB123